MHSATSFLEHRQSKGNSGTNLADVINSGFLRGKYLKLRKM